MTRLSIHIDKLVLPKHVDPRDVTQALRRALAQEIRQNGTALDGLRQMQPRSQLDAVRVPEASGPNGLGQAISQAVIRQPSAKGGHRP